jgi:DNA-binding NarL/FixJ family response regulator
MNRDPRKRRNALGLTPRQTDVLASMARGNCIKRVARETGMACATVKIHTAAILATFGVPDRTSALAHIAKLAGIDLAEWVRAQ